MYGINGAGSNHPLGAIIKQRCEKNLIAHARESDPKKSLELQEN